MEVQYQAGDKITTVTVERHGDHFRVQVGDRVYDITATQPEPGRLDLQVGNRRLRAYVARDERGCWVALAGESWLLERPERRPRRGGTPGSPEERASLEAGMPGLVLDVLVAEGDRVTRGDTLVLLEGMKMELRISAPYSGRVGQVRCAAGQMVERGQVLVEIEREA
jgi:acetyl/propionyl-CoA carboxylase alpha subunit